MDWRTVHVIIVALTSLYLWGLSQGSRHHPSVIVRNDQGVDEEIRGKEQRSLAEFLTHELLSAEEPSESSHHRPDITKNEQSVESRIRRAELQSMGAFLVQRLISTQEQSEAKIDDHGSGGWRGVPRNVVTWPSPNNLYASLLQSTEDASVYFGIFVGILVLIALWFLWKSKYHLKFREVNPSLGRLLLWAGFDSYDAFDCEIFVHEMGYPEKINTKIAIEAYFEREETAVCRHGPSNLPNVKAQVAVFEKALVLHVPQGTEEVILKALDDSTNHVIAEGRVPIKQVLEPQEPQPQSFAMKRKGKGKKMLAGDPPLSVSFYPSVFKDEDGDGEDDAAAEGALLRGLDLDLYSLEFKMLIKSLSRAQAQNSGCLHKSLNLKQLAEHQLKVLAHACRGKLLIQSGFFDSQQSYFFAVYTDEDNVLKGWKLGWWKAKQVGDKVHNDDFTKVPPVDCIPMLSIESITENPNNNEELIIDYMPEKRDAKSISLLRVDRSRELWMDCLSVFTSHLRHIRMKIKAMKEGQDSSTSKRVSKHSSSRQSSSHDSTTSAERHKKSHHGSKHGSSETTDHPSESGYD